MKPFTRNEIIVVVFILLGISIVSLFNFRSALRRSRDAQRRSDANSVMGSLELYKEATGRVPDATQDGRIKACEPEGYAELIKKLEEKEINTDEYFENLLPCEWGQTSLADLVGGEIFLESIPLDPRTGEGYAYKYISNGRIFQLYTYLEGASAENGYDQAILDRNLDCGVNICNQGGAFGKTPLDKSLEEYENELAGERQGK